MTNTLVSSRRRVIEGQDVDLIEKKAFARAGVRLNVPRESTSFPGTNKATAAAPTLFDVAQQKHSYSHTCMTRRRLNRILRAGSNLSIKDPSYRLLSRGLLKVIFYGRMHAMRFLGLLRDTQHWMVSQPVIEQLTCADAIWRFWLVWNSPSS